LIYSAYRSFRCTRYSFIWRSVNSSVCKVCQWSLTNVWWSYSCCFKTFVNQDFNQWEKVWSLGYMSFVRLPFSKFLLRFHDLHCSSSRWIFPYSVIVSNVNRYEHSIWNNMFYQIHKPFSISPWWILHWNYQFDCSCALFTRRFNWVLRKTDTNMSKCICPRSFLHLSNLHTYSPRPLDHIHI
jgi:hypothetical protein